MFQDVVCDVRYGELYCVCAVKPSVNVGAQMLQETDKVFTVVVSSLTDGADDVVRRSLAVLAEICSSSTQQPGALTSYLPAAGRLRLGGFPCHGALPSCALVLYKTVSQRLPFANRKSLRSGTVERDDCCAGDLESSPYYYKFLRALLRLLAADESLLEDRGAFIIRCRAAPSRTPAGAP